jgi:molecular chaperone GrpE
LETNSETVNGQEAERKQEAAASAAEPEQEAAEALEDRSAEAPAAEAPAADGDKAGEPEDPIAALSDALAQAQAQAEEYLDGWQRARAEFANYRRREELRREQSTSEIAERVLSHFLPVLDDLERAFSSVPPEVQGNPWVEGLSLVAQKMLSGMEKEGVSVMPTELGEAFDPNVHMAVLHSPCADYDEGQIAMILQRGYTIGKRVLRPAMVQVSSGRIEDVACESKAEAPQEGASGDLDTETDE